MILHLPYSEIRQFIRKHYRQEIEIRFIDRYNASLSYTLRRFVPKARIILRIESLTTEQLILSYDGRRGTSLLMRGLTAVMDKKINKDILEITPTNKKIYVHLNAIEGIQETFRYLNPEAIFFGEDGLFLTLGLA